MHHLEAPFAWMPFLGVSCLPCLVFVEQKNVVVAASTESVILDDADVS